MHFIHIRLLFQHFISRSEISELFTQNAFIFDFVIDYAIEQDIDLFLFAGDAFKFRNPTSTHQKLFAQIVLHI